MDHTGLAPDQKKAARRGASLIFLDETGIFLMPLVHRTWAPRGQTPVLQTRTRHHRHLSVIGAITISPKMRRLGWYLGLHANTSIRQAEVIAFLRDLLRHVRGAIVLLWDRLNAHRGCLVREFLRCHPRLEAEHFPPYAPELNPNEYGWAHLKGHRLANYCPDDLDELEKTVQQTLPTVTRNQTLLGGFIRATKLPLRIPKRHRA